MLIENGVIKNVYTPKTFKKRKQVIDQNCPKGLLFIVLFVVIFLQFIAMFI